MSHEKFACRGRQIKPTLQYKVQSKCSLASPLALLASILASANLARRSRRRPAKPVRYEPVKLSRYLLIVWLAIAAGNVLGAEKKAMPPPEPSFQGDRAAVELAEGMFDAVGGKPAWAALRALYIKAEHTEPQIPAPYQSEIWRGIDEFELRIDQGNDSFHALARVNAQGGTVTYLDDRDSTRVLST